MVIKRYPLPFKTLWCRRGDSNPYGQRPLDPESSASANSATSAHINYNIKIQEYVCLQL